MQVRAGSGSLTAITLATAHAALVGVFDYILARFLQSKLLVPLSAISLLFCLAWFAIWPRVIWRQGRYRVPVFALGLPIMVLISLWTFVFFLFVTGRLSH